MEEIHFKVQGSSPNPYEVFFRYGESGRLSAFCACAAGSHHTFCKHRMQVLEGPDDGITVPSGDALEKVRGWYRGTPLEKAMHEVLIAERNFETAKEAHKVAKANLSRVMEGR